MNELAVDLADIVDPVAPLAATPVNIAWFVVPAVLLALIIAIAVWWRRSTPRRRALRNVRELQRNFSHGALTVRELAYGIAETLRMYLKLHRLRASAIPNVTDAAQQQAWRELVQRIDVLRYQPQADCSAAEIQHLIRDSATWLRLPR